MYVTMYLSNIHICRLCRLGSSKKTVVTSQGLSEERSDPDPRAFRFAAGLAAGVARPRGLCAPIAAGRVRLTGRLGTNLRL